MKTLLLFCAGCLMAVFSQAQIIHVPGDYPSIQQGINAAANGDTILVSDGTYYEQINFLGKKPLMVASEFLTTGDSSHIANTIIDGSQIPAGDSCSVVYFINGEDSTSVICGFTIQGGHGSLWEFWGMHGGGGIYCLNGASIVNNIIQNNEITVALDNAGAGGILVVSTSPVHISENIIRNNFVDCQSAGYNWAIGGGIMCVLSNNCRHTINSNLIEGNEVHTSSNYSAGGGGIVLQECSVLLENNVLKNNTSSRTGSSTAKGGALEWYIYQAGSCIRNNIILNNTADDEGGGVRIETTNLLELLIENNYFNGDSSKLGGALCTWASKLCLQNNVFSSNQASSMGGAINIHGANLDHTAVLLNNSFYQNSTGGLGGAIYSFHGRPLIINSIFYQDTAGSDGNEIYLATTSDTAEIAFSDIDPDKIKGYSSFHDGGGNIPGLDPLFMSPDFLMISKSGPCYDHGTDMYTCTHGITYDCPDYDIRHAGRPWDLAFDMGAYENDLGGIYPSDQVSLKADIYPNPTNGIVECRFSIADSRFMSISLYDQIGRDVRMVVNEQLEAGEHKIRFDITGLPAGFYFLKLTAGNRQSAVGKIIKL